MTEEKITEALFQAICDYRFPNCFAIDQLVVNHLMREAKAYAGALAALSLPEPTEGQALVALKALDLLIDFSEPCSEDKPWIFEDWSELNKAFELADAALRAPVSLQDHGSKK